MLKKTYYPKSDRCRITFKLPAEVEAETVCLVGEFNNWDTQADPMKKLKDGSYSCPLTLKAGASYRFRYLIDGERWENDWTADAYEPNPYGSDDSVAET